MIGKGEWASSRPQSLQICEEADKPVRWWCSGRRVHARTRDRTARPASSETELPPLFVTIASQWPVLERPSGRSQRNRVACECFDYFADQTVSRRTWSWSPLCSAEGWEVGLQEAPSGPPQTAGPTSLATGLPGWEPARSAGFSTWLIFLSGRCRWQQQLSVVLNTKISIFCFSTKVPRYLTIHLKEKWGH